MLYITEVLTDGWLFYLAVSVGVRGVIYLCSFNH